MQKHRFLCAILLLCSAPAPAVPSDGGEAKVMVAIRGWVASRCRLSTPDLQPMPDAGGFARFVLTLSDMCNPVSRYRLWLEAAEVANVTLADGAMAPLGAPGQRMIRRGGTMAPRPHTLLLDIGGKAPRFITVRMQPEM